LHNVQLKASRSQSISFSHMQHFLHQLPKFVSHHHIKNVQAAFYNQSRASVNPGEICLQVDFAENYLCQHQDETQAAHWLQSQITVFTACLWSSDGHHSYVVVSNNLSHEKSVVAVFLTMVLRSYQSGGNQFKRLTIFSDGAASQFKNKFIVALLPRLCEVFQLETIQWSFFASAHGKGPVDGIGGQAKRMVWRSVMARKVVSVSNAQQFADVLMAASSNINVLLSTDEREKELYQELGVQSIFANAPQVIFFLVSSPLSIIVFMSSFPTHTISDTRNHTKALLAIQLPQWSFVKAPQCK
jgi:hypothetical protein